MSLPTDTSTLSYLGHVLTQSGYTVEWRGATRDTPYEQLLVEVSDPTPVAMRLVVAEEVAEALNAEAKEKSVTTYMNSLVTSVYFPKIEALDEDDVPALSALLNALNGRLAFGSLAHNSAENIHLKHAFAYPAEAIDPRLVAEIVSGLAVQARKYQPVLQAWVSGTRPQSEILKELS